ncbi:MAG: hypothetical protein M3Y53_04035 [Thermoproteota archaeon]|nr:hypothetical protein [Thermoproteota archaeon]
MLRNNPLLSRRSVGVRKRENDLRGTNIKQLYDELRWNAEVHGIRLAEMYSTSNLFMSDA